MNDDDLGTRVGAYLDSNAAEQLRNSMMTALPINPDSEAQSRQYANTLRIPVGDARSAPAATKVQAQLQALDADTIATKFPNTARWLINPDNAALAHDDLATTTAIEGHAQALGAAPTSPAPTPYPFTQTFATPAAPTYGDRLNAWLRDLVGAPPAGRDEGAAARAFLDVTAKQRGITRDDLRTAIGGMSPVPQQFGQGYFDSALAGLGGDNAGAPDTTAGGIARGVGTLAGFLQGLPLKIAASVAERIPGLAPTVGQSFVKGLARDVSRQATTLGIASGITAAGSALDTSSASDATGVVGKAAASGAEMGAVFGAAGRLFPDNTLMQFGARALGVNASLDAMNGARPWDERPLAQKVFDYGLNTVFAADGAGRVGGGWLHDAARADVAQADANVLGALADASAASKLRDRAPDAFHDFMADVTQDGPVPAVYIDARQLAKALHQSGVGSDELTAKLPGVADQLPEALSTGGQVRIPIEDFATHIAGGPLQEPLMQHLRTDPEGMTLAESNAFMQSHLAQLADLGKSIAEQREIEAPEVTSRTQVFQNVKAQLDSTGRFPDGVSDSYAALHGAFYATMAERAGMLPHELLEKYPVRIAAQSPTDATLSAPGQRGAYDPVTNTIAAFKGADLSTVLHESGHHFLDVLSHMAAAPDAPEGIKADMAAALKSFNVPDLDAWHSMSLDEQRASHEEFARGFERYLMEGKAPSIEMRGLFARFRSWLTHIYKSLAVLKVDLSPDVRGVFDRMLASSDAIHNAETARRYMPLFDTPEKAAMSPTEWAAYQALGKDATAEAIDSLTSKTVRDMAWLDRTRSAALKALGKDADEKRRAIAREVRGEVLSQPVYRAWTFLTSKDTSALPEPPGEAELAHKEAARAWTDQRAAQEQQARAAARSAAWEASAAPKAPSGNPGLAKGQFISRNRARIDLEVQRAMLEWDESNPKPQAPKKVEQPTSIDPTTGSGKLNTKLLRSSLGADAQEKLSALRMTGADGLDPGIVADMFGFSDSGALAKALTEAEAPDRVIASMVDQRMLERHGEIANPQSLARVADELVHNEVRTRFIATELRALNKAIGPARDLAKAAKEVAESTIDAKRVRAINEGQFSVAETRAAREAEKRLAAGDTAGAAVAKRDQLLNVELGRAARDALDYVRKAVDYLGRFDNASVREGIDLEYRDQIDALLDRYDLRGSTTGKALDRREALLQFVERMASQGYEPQIPEALLDEAQRQHYKDMRLQDFKGLVDAVKSIEHLGKLKSKLLDLRESREISDLADEVKATAGALKQSTPETNRGLSRIGAAWLNAKTAGRSLQASLLKMEQMFDWLDGRNPNGVLNRVVFRRLADAGIRENDLLAQVKGQIDDLVKSHLADVTRDGGKVYTAPGLIDGLTGKPQRFTKKQMLMLAGNMGNESNAAKMAQGEKWNQAEVWNFLNAHMSKADWNFVAGMGKALESLWPEKIAMSRRLGNTNPDKIAPRSFDTPHGSYEGWYWPIIYDPARAQDVAERGARQGDALFENIYRRANTDTGRLNTRNENYARPLLLDLDALPRVIKDEIHDIAFREAVVDASRFLSHATVRTAIVDALSQQHYDQLNPWLQSIANDGKTSTEGMRALKFFNDLASGVRTRATIVGLGYRVSTMLVHGASAGLESVAELGPVWFASGLKDFANPGQWTANKDFIFERSGEMRNRMNEVDRDVREHLRDIDTKLMDPASGAVARGADIFKAHAYQGIAMLDMASALPTWMGAYKKAMTPEARGGLGMGEEDAVYFADKTVRNAHGGTGVKDLAAVQRGPEILKLFTMFYTFWNHNVNRLMDTGRLAADPNTWKDSQLASQVIMRTLIYTLGVQAMHALVHPPKEGDDEESWAAWAGKELLASAFAGVPIARDLSAHYLTARDYSVTPAASMVSAFDHTKVDAVNALTGEEVSDKWLKHTVTTAGYVFALPTGQLGGTAQFLWDVQEGRQHPASAAEWWNGILHGEAKSH